MHRQIVTILLLSAVLLACGAADKEKKEKAAADPTDAGEQPAPGKGKGDDKGKGDKGQSAKKTAKADTNPACMHCGATCGLAAICVCEPGTKKQPKVEFDVECEPICIAGCGSMPWPLGKCGIRVGCTHGCQDPCLDPCRCPTWVRNRKRLKKETVDEDVPTINRKVAYVCDCCAGRCTSSCSSVVPCPRPSSWWTRLGWW